MDRDKINVIVLWVISAAVLVNSVVTFGNAMHLNRTTKAMNEAAREVLEIVKEKTKTPESQITKALKDRGMIPLDAENVELKFKFDEVE